MCDPISSRSELVSARRHPATGVQRIDDQPPAVDRQDEPGRLRGCHGSINPPGFALENYDSIGRYRANEPFVDPMTGMKVNDLPIDSTVDMLLDGSAPTHVEGGLGLGAALAASEVGQECFGRQWFRFVSGREEATDDGCVVGDIVDAVKQGAPIKDAFKRIALAPEFRLRRVDRK